MRKKLLIVTISFFFGIIAIFFYLLLLDRNPNVIPSNLINKNIPEFETTSLFTGKKFISSNEFKDKITLVNFFATWCLPCREEMPFIKKFSQNKNINIIGINYKDHAGKTINWLKKLGNPYSKIAMDESGKIGIDWGVYGIPETFIINSNGIIKYRHVGPVTKEIYIKFKLIIAELT